MRKMARVAMVANTIESRRRRDERGRYMGDEDDRRMGGRYMDDDMPEMYGRYEKNTPQGGGGRYEDNRYRHNGGRDRPGMRDDDRPDMGGEGYFIWDGMDQPESRRHMPPIRYHQEGGNITDMRTYGRRFSPQGNAGGEYPQHRQIGFQQGGRQQEDGQHLTREQAEQWVQNMRSGDHRGGKWKFDEIRQYAQNYGVTGEQKVIDFFAVMNAMYSDYHKVARKFGVDKTDFYAELAKAFLDDDDAVEGKARVYYECIAGGMDDGTA